MSLLTLKSRGNFHATAPLSNSYTNCWIKEKGWLYLRMDKCENIGDERSRVSLFCIRFRLSDLNTGTNIEEYKPLSKNIGGIFSTIIIY
jgi:hypothetical protein